MVITLAFRTMWHITCLQSRIYFVAVARSTPIAIHLNGKRVTRQIALPDRNSM